MKTPTRLETFVDRLDGEYGAPVLPRPVDPLGLILWEQVAYLADDDRRAQAFDLLEARVGLAPGAILAASRATLEEIARVGGATAVTDRAGRMQQTARVAAEEWGGDLGSVLALPPAEARRVLKRFPMIGEPGVDKILLLTRTHPILALDSNGLRVLLRLGYGREAKSYSATYRNVRDAAAEDCPSDVDWLATAHGLLRCHGQRRCKRTSPLCAGCCLASACPSAR